MPTLYDLATVIRSKNAGPFTLTVDLLFDRRETYDRVAGSPRLSAEAVARLYDVPEDRVRIHRFGRVLAIKVTLPRHCGAGSPRDRDVYGSQQHFPLAGLDI